MQIRAIEISNWRNIDTATLQFNQGINIIHGRNETGKSTVQEAAIYAVTKSASINTREAQEIVPWGTALKARVKLIFLSRDNRSYKIDKSYPKGDAYLYYLPEGGGELPIAEGKNVQPELYKILGISEEITGLYDLLWVSQGESLKLFDKTAAKKLLSDQARMLIKNVIKENLLSKEVEEFYRQIEYEYAAVITSAGKVKKNTDLWNLRLAKERLTEEVTGIGKKIDSMAEKQQAVIVISESLKDLAKEKAVKKETLLHLEKKKKEIDTLRSKEAELKKAENENIELLKIQEEEEKAAVELPYLLYEQERLLEKELRETEAGIEKTKETVKQLEAVEAEIKACKLKDRKILTELERLSNNIREAETRLEASGLNVTVDPLSEAVNLSFDVAKDKKEPQTIIVSKKEHFSASRNITLRYDEKFELSCTGPLSEEEFNALTLNREKDLSQKEFLLKENGIENLEEGKEAYTRYESLTIKKKELEHLLSVSNRDALEKRKNDLREQWIELEKEKGKIVKEGITLKEKPGDFPVSKFDYTSISNKITGFLTASGKNRERKEAILSGKSLADFKNNYFRLKDEVEYIKSRVEKIEPKDVEAVTDKDLQTLRNDIEVIEDKVNGINEKRITLSVELRNAGELGEKKYRLEHEYGEALKKLKAETTRINVLRLLLELMAEEKERLDDILNPFEDRMGEAFVKITGERYPAVSLNENFEVGVTAKTHAGALPVLTDSLSYGTREQLSFLFRFIIAQYLSLKEPQVMLLDDSFVNTDGGRLAVLMEMIKEYSEKIQFLIFTCQYENYAPFKKIATFIPFNEVTANSNTNG
ncbi:MAG: AAA family ATPase [Spirochaetota bacterium]